LKTPTEEGGFRAIIDRSCPLGKIVEAYRYIESGQKIGIVVIQVIETEAACRITLCRENPFVACVRTDVMRIETMMLYSSGFIKFR